MWRDPIGVKLSLRSPTVIDDSSGIWRVTKSNNPLALQKAFDKREAYPTDVDSQGSTLSHVRTTKCMSFFPLAPSTTLHNPSSVVSSFMYLN